RLRDALAAAGWRVAVDAGPRQSLFEHILGAQRRPLPQAADRRGLRPSDRLARFGAGVLIQLRETGQVFGFAGLTLVALARAAANPRRLRWRSVAAQVDRIGVQAAGIVALLTFLVGLVLAYQSVDQFERFGAEPLAVNVLGIIILREFGVLIAAILVAGRSGSAFCAEIGFMRANEEIDAMRAMGVDPIEALVLPRLIGALIALPLLTVLADIAGVAGGVAYILLSVDMTVAQVIERLDFAVLPETFLLGLAKAPAFAALIALVGCHKGAQVGGGADIVGRKTTESVVLSIFLVIVANAAFSVGYAIAGF
ncbi:MAG: ABC transporter permease, partial [Pseudomonadota bacterium]